MKSARLFVIGTTLSCAAMLACNAISGIGDLTSSDDEQDGSVSDTGKPSSSTDAGTDSATMDTGRPEVIVAPPPTCTCVAAPTPGWTGPLLLLEVNDDAGSPCPTGLTPLTTGGTDLDTPSPACAPCLCTGSNTCTSVTGSLYNSPACTTTTGCFQKAITSTCTAITYCSAGESASMAAVTTATCSPSGGAKKPASWKQSATTCALTAPLDDKQCASASLVCAPKSDGAKNAKTCIVKDNSDEACPVGSPYTTKLTYHSALNDNRTCGACSCINGTAQCSAATVTLYSDTACANAVTSIMGNGCTGAFLVSGAQGSAKITTNATTLDAGCTPSGGIGAGSLAPDKPTTVCCLP